MAKCDLFFPNFIPACGSISLNISSTSRVPFSDIRSDASFHPLIFIFVLISHQYSRDWLLWLHVSDINSTLRLIFFCCWISYLSSHFPDIKWAHYSRMSGKTSAQIFQTSYWLQRKVYLSLHSDLLVYHYHPPGLMASHSCLDAYRIKGALLYKTMITDAVRCSE